MKAKAMKVMVATTDRFEKRARPQMPCPEVQPEPKVTPMPVIRPPATKAASGTGTS